MNICLCRGTAGGGLPLEQFVKLAADSGFGGADVDMSYAEKSGVTALRDLYAEREMAFGGWGPPVDWRGEAAKQAEGLERLAKIASIASELKIDSCATWIMPSSDLPFMENWKFHVSRIKPVAERLAHHGLRFGLEFVAPYHLRRKFKHEFIFTPGLMLELADAIGPNVGLLIDCFHMHCAGETLAMLESIVKQRIVLVHINDAPRVPVAEVDDGKRLLPGDGAIDVKGFLTSLKKTGYDGPVSLEVFNADLRAMTPAEAAKKAWEATQRVLPS